MPSSWRGRAPPPQIVLATDPGPDPDDVKALLILAVLHKQGAVRLRAVICSGGGQPEKRAALAKCLLRHLGEGGVPVGVGSAGRPSAARPHEYALAGYVDVRPADLEPGHELLMRVLRTAKAATLTLVCVASLRDFADAMVADAELFVSKVKQVAIQGGLERAEDGSWRPDSSVNNMFDFEAAELAYGFCFRRGVPMTVTSRLAVPLLPMQLARSFADVSNCPVMTYLASAQFLGLEGLWQKLCDGELPPRCTKQWYFETFCGVDAASFSARGLDRLDARTQIVQHLNGYVKPYDVLALMTVLPLTSAFFSQLKQAQYTIGGARHLLFLDSSCAIPASYVINLLRDTYIEVVHATAGKPARAQRSAPWMRSQRRSPMLDTERLVAARAAESEPGRGREPGDANDRSALRGLGALWRPNASAAVGGRASTAGEGAGGPSADRKKDARAVAVLAAQPGVQRSAAQPSTADSSSDELRDESAPSFGPAAQRVDVLSYPATCRLLETALFEASSRQVHISRPASIVGLSLAAVGVLAFVLDVALLRAIVRYKTANDPLIRVTAVKPIIYSAVPIALLAIHPTPAQAWRLRLWAAAFLALMFLVLAGSVLTLAQAAGGAGGLAAAPIDSAVLVLHVVRGVACTAALAVGIARNWARQRQLCRWLWVVVGAYTGVLSLADVILLADRLARAQIAPPAERGERVALLILLAVAVVLGLATSCAELHPRFRPRMQAWLGRSWRPLSRRATIAPLIGFGSEDRDPTVIVAEAHDAFRVAVGSDDYFRSRCLGDLRKGRVAGAQASDRLSRISGSRRSAPADSVAPGAFSAPVEPLAAALPHPMPKLSPFVADVIDMYICHSPHDAAEHKLDALRAFCAAARAGSGGGADPTLWLDGSCAAERLRLEQHLAFMPVYMARCRKLVLLWGPTLARCEWCIAELVCWAALKGGLHGVTVVPVVGPGESRARDVAAIIASVDAFHVANCRSLPGQQSERIDLMLEIATVAHVNATVRSFYPLVRDACNALDS